MTEAARPDDDAMAILGALAEQRACYEEMLSIAAGQRDALLADGPDPLLEVVRRKQQVMERVEAIGRRSAGARDRWVGERDLASPALRSEVDRRADEVAEVLRRLLAAEEEAARMAGALRDETLGRLRQQADTQRLRGAYGKREEEGPKLFDTKQE